MKVLVLYDYPPSPGGLATQGDLLFKGLQQLGVEVCPANFESAQEKEWYYHWFRPDVVVGVGYWGHTPHLVLHPQKYGVRAVPWLVADGFVANYRDVLDSLPLILTTSQWVKDVYVRDGIRGDDIHVLPVGCDTDSFIPRPADDPRVRVVRESLGVAPDELMILTVGGDAASKGGQEVMQALALISKDVPKWKYVCKVWPQQRTEIQNRLDMALAEQLGIKNQIVYASNKVSRTFMPYLMAACDIYAAPSRLEGFGMPQVEAGACGKPVISINAMAPAETLVHGETALLAGVGQEIRVAEAVVGEESGFPKGHRVVFEKPRIVDYRASYQDVAVHLKTLMNDTDLRARMGAKGRERAVARYDYRVVAQTFIDLVRQKLGIQ
jgi:alpha-maltose-1-phosphate synthase